MRASSADNVWVFGSDSTHALEAMRWDGSHWLAALAIPAGAPDNPVVLGPSDVWLSYFAAWTRARGWMATSWHWDGREWHTYTLPILTTDMGLAGSSDQNLWAAGITTTSSNRNALGHLATYRWNGHAWHRIRLPRAFVVRDPELSASTSGETWIVAGGSKRVHGHAVVLFRGASTWRQLDERRLSSLPAPVGYPEAPDGLNGIRLGLNLYWPGSGPVEWSPVGCSHALYASIGPSMMDGVPRTHRVLLAAACQQGSHGTIEGAIMISKPR